MPCVPMRAFSPCVSCSPPRPDIVHQLLLLDDIEHRQRHAAREWRSAIGCAVAAGVNTSGTAPRSRPRPWGNPRRSTSPSQSHRAEILPIFNAFENPLVALPPAGPEIAVLHTVPQEQQIVLLGQRPQAEQVFRRRDEHAAFALDSLDLHRDRLRRDGRFNGPRGRCRERARSPAAAAQSRA